MSDNSSEGDRPARHDRRSRTSVASILSRLDKAQLSVTEGGKRRQMPTIEVQHILFFNKAINGQLPALRMIIKLAQDYGPRIDRQPRPEPAQKIKVLVGDEKSERVHQPGRAATRGVGDYAIGHRRPPEHTRYKPGQSGNPNGRPKRTEDQTYEGEAFWRVAFEKIDLRTDDGSEHVTRMEATLRKLHAMSLEADTRAGILLNKLRKTMPVPARRRAPVVIRISEADAKV